MAQMAEYKVSGIGGNGNQGPEPGHGTFTGYVASDGPSKYTPKRKSLKLDWDAIEAMREEHNARLEQMDNGGSYWS